MTGDVFSTSSRRRTDLDRLTIGADAQIQDGITAIDAGRAQIALVVDHQRRLVGTLTDGDIRRGLLRDLTLEDSVAKEALTEEHLIKKLWASCG